MRRLEIEEPIFSNDNVVVELKVGGPNLHDALMNARKAIERQLLEVKAINGQHEGAFATPPREGPPLWEED